MNLSDNDMEEIITRFPKMNLSNDQIVHKMFADVYQSIPCGNKVFAWFTWFKNKNVCIFLESNSINHTITNIFIKPVCFHNDLSLNTLLYGTMISNNRFFVIDDILMYKNRDVSKLTYSDKLDIYSTLLNKEINPTMLTNLEVIITLPIMNSNYETLCKEIIHLPYTISGIAMIRLKQYSTRNIIKYISVTDPITFLVKAEIQSDIYSLYIKDNDSIIYYDTAYIPTIVCSKMMNSLFRNIKENNRLDATEESDDEEMFQNINDDKYVYTDRSYNMICVYTSFKKWVPIRCVTTTISNKNKLYNI
jgi:hypothetical protein